MPHSSKNLRMSGLECISRIDQVARALRSSIHARVWTRQLPGIRPIASELHVSVSTVSAALARLCEEGVIERSGARRRFRICQCVTESSSPPAVHLSRPATTKHVLLLAPRTGIAGNAKPLLDIEMRLWESLTQHDWTVRFQRVDYGTDGRRRRQWDQLLELGKFDAIVAYAGTPWLARWAVNCGTPVCFLGGNPGPHPVPTVGMSGITLLRRALNELFQLGHTRITMPLCGNAHSFIGVMGAIMAEEFRNAGLPFQARLALPTSQFHEVSDYLGCLERVWPKLQPTAVICICWAECLGVYSFALRHGLRIPEDLSIITFSSDPAAVNWLMPVPARFVIPIDTLAANLRDWVLKPEFSGSQAPFLAFDAEWNPGGSLQTPAR